VKIMIMFFEVFIKLLVIEIIILDNKINL
jgi:hypothetical protein